MVCIRTPEGATPVNSPAARSRYPKVFLAEIGACRYCKESHVHDGELHCRHGCREGSAHPGTPCIRARSTGGACGVEARLMQPTWEQTRV